MTMRKIALSLLSTLIPGLGYAQDTVARDVVHIAGRAYVRTQLRAGPGNPHGLGIGLEAAAGECVTGSVDEQQHFWLFRFDRWLRRTPDPLDGGLLPSPNTYYSKLRWRGGFLWLMTHTDFELYLRRIDPRQSAPTIEFTAISQVFFEGRFDLDARDGVVFAVIDGSENDGDEFGVFGRLLAYDGTPLTPRLRLAVGPITPSYTGNPALLPSGASIVFHRDPPGWHTRLLSTGDWSMSPWIFLGSEPVGTLRALADGTLLVWRFDQTTGLYSVQRMQPDGVFLGDEIEIGARPLEWFGATSAGELALATALSPPASFRLFGANGTPLGEPISLPLTSTLPIHRITDAEYTEDGTFWITWYATDATFQVFEDYLTAITPVSPGDLNGDGVLSNLDIDPFVLALIDRPAYEALHEGLPADTLGDLDGDGALTNFDIDPLRQRPAVAAVTAFNDPALPSGNPAFHVVHTVLKRSSPRTA